MTIKAILFYSILFILLFCLAVAPVADGYLFKKNYLQLLNNLHVSTVQIKNVDYQLGLLSSTAKFQVILTDNGEDKTFDITQIIKHGPFLFDPNLRTITLGCAYITTTLLLPKSDRHFALLNPQDEGKLLIVSAQTFSTQINGLIGMPDFIWTQASGAKFIFQGVKTSFHTAINANTVQNFNLLVNADVVSFSEPNHNITAKAQSVTGQLVAVTENNSFKINGDIQGPQVIIAFLKLKADVIANNFSAHLNCPSGKKNRSILSAAEQLILSQNNTPFATGDELSATLNFSEDFNLNDILSNFKPLKKWTASFTTEIKSLSNFDNQVTKSSLKNIHHQLDVEYNDEKKSITNFITIATASVKSANANMAITENNIADKIIATKDKYGNITIGHDFNSGLLSLFAKDVLNLQIPTIKWTFQQNNPIDNSYKSSFAFSIPTTTIDFINSDEKNSISIANINISNSTVSGSNKITNISSQMHLDKMLFLNDSIGPIETFVAFNKFEFDSNQTSQQMDWRNLKKSRTLFILPASTYVGRITIKSPYGDVSINNNINWNTKIPLSTLTMPETIISKANLIGDIRVSIAMLEHYIDSISQYIDGGSGNMESIIKNYILALIQQGFLKIDKTDYFATITMKDGGVYFNGVLLVELPALFPTNNVIQPDNQTATTTE